MSDRFILQAVGGGISRKSVANMRERIKVALENILPFWSHNNSHLRLNIIPLPPQKELQPDT
jgi:hypothetical protein